MDSAKIAPADGRAGLSAFCETFALDREELTRLRAMAVFFFELLGATLAGWGLSISLKSLLAEIEGLESLREKCAHGLGIAVRFDRTTLVLMLDQAATNACLGRIFGSDGIWPENQALTGLELATLSGSLGPAAAEAMQTVFGGLLGAKAHPLPAFVNEPQARNPLFTEDRVLAVRASVETSGRAGSILLMLPLGPLVAARSRLKVAEEVSPERSVERLAVLEKLDDLEVELSAICAQLEVDIGAIGGLKPGATLPLGLQAPPGAKLLLRANLCIGPVALGQGVVVDDRGWRRILIEDANGGRESAERNGVGSP